MEVVICTDQSALFREYQELCKRLIPSVTLRLLSQVAPHLPLVPAQGENLLTYVQNLANQLQLPVLAEESLLTVPTLQQQYRCQLSIEEHTKSRLSLLRALQEKMPCDRSACLECLIVFCMPNGSAVQFKGSCEGTLLDKEQGSGFGFDPLFRKHSYNQTLAQLPSHVKSSISDRSKAFGKWALWLESHACCLP